MTDLGEYNSWEPGEKRVIYLLAVGIFLVTSPVVPQIILIWTGKDYPIAVFALYFLMMPPMILLHELIHAAFEWLFGKKRPSLGFSFPFPYSKSAAGVSDSRNQAIAAAIAPFLAGCLSLVLVPFVAPLFQVGILFLFFLHAPSCAGDLRLTQVLLKYPRSARVRVVGKTNVIYEPSMV